MRAFMSKINEPLRTSILTQLNWFIQSAVKGTLPKKARTKRTVFTLINPDAKKNKKRYRVPYRTFKKRGVAYFSSKKQANEFAKIKYRFLQKNQWIEAGKAITNNLKVKMRKTTTESKQKADVLSNGVNDLHSRKPSILLILNSLSPWSLQKAGVKATYATQRRVKYNENKIVKDYSNNWKKTR
jgi:hypothetical protein